MKKKGLALVLALTLVVVGIVSGTLAWLTDTSDQVVNTFTTSDITVELAETTNSYKMVPGCDIAKDPKATVKTGSEPCYLFVKLVKSGNYNDYLEDYTVATDWTKLTGTGVPDTVYYRVVDGTTNTFGTAYDVLAGNKVTVKGSVTKEMMNTLTAATYPTLTITAYASQLYKSAGVEFSAAEAWANVNA